MTLHGFSSKYVDGEMRTNANPSLVMLLATVLLTMIGGPTARAQSPKREVVERATRATVMVWTHSSKGKKADTKHGSGSGFFVNSTGLLVTNDHVTNLAHGGDQGAKYDQQYKVGRIEWRIVVDSGTEDEQTYQARYVDSTDAGDMCILQAVDEDGEHLETPDYYRFRPSDELTLGTNAWCLGFPGGDSRREDRDKHPKVASSKGTIVDLPHSPSGRLTKVVTDVEANPGNSGGPMMDIHGRVIGIATQLGDYIAGRTHVTELVPSALVQQMIQQAFRQRLMESGIDITPFYDLFLLNDRTWELPFLGRLTESDCVVLEGESRFCGSAADDVLTWSSPLGDIDVPASAMAYLHANEEDDHAMVLLDGGDRFLINRDEGQFRLKLIDGSVVTFDLSEVVWIAFRRPEKAPSLPQKSAYFIGGDDFGVSLFDVKGNVIFEPLTGNAMSIPATRLRRIATTDTDDRVLYLSDGSRLVGDFQEHQLTAQLAWTGTPITFSFENVENAVIKTIPYDKLNPLRERALAESLSTTDRRLVRIAKQLDAGDLPGAGQELATLMDSTVFKNLAPNKKEQVRCLDGELSLRLGKFDKAGEVFRRLKKARVPDVRVHALARYAMLERYPDGMYEGKPISRRDVFTTAAIELAEDFTRDAKRTMEELMIGTPSSHGDYRKLVKSSKVAEERLQVASRFKGSSADPYLFRLWHALIDWHEAEDHRLQEERQSLEKELEEMRRDGNRRLTRSQDRQYERKLARIDRFREELSEETQQLKTKLRHIGFIVDDPNFYTPRERE